MPASISKNEHLKHNLDSVDAARITETQATSERADQTSNTETEHLLEKVREELIEAHRAKDAAELTLKQAREQLAMENEDIDTGLKKKKPRRTERTRRRHSRR